MQNVILVIHILACLAIIGLVLVQKSEGGGLGVGGGGANSLMSGRGAAGAIVRTTIIIGGIFFATSLALTSIANRSQAKPSGIEKALEEADPGAVPSKPDDLFDPSVTLLPSESASPGALEPAAPTTAPAPGPATSPATVPAAGPTAATPAPQGPETASEPAPAAETPASEPIPQ